MKPLLFSCLFLLAFSCKKNTSNNPVVNPPNNNPAHIFDMKVPAGFTYENFNTISFELTLLKSNDKPGKNIIVTLSDNGLGLGSKIYIKGKADANGVFRGTINLPKSSNQVICNTSLIGIPENIVIPIQTPNIILHLGGSNPQMVKTLENTQSDNHYFNLYKAAPKYSYSKVPAWNANGVPSNLALPRDTVSNQMVNDIWAALPSTVSVATNHPSWLDDNACKRTLLVTQTADVWVTFVTEGAGYRNTLFYYKYNKNNPPVSANDIDSLYVIFPNASLASSGGGLVTGDRVFIGRFGPDTVIAYGIAANGYNISTGTVGAGDWLFYANKNFNTESNSSLRQHLVMLYDAPSKRYIMGFEDIIRTAGGCDHDFNDVMFYTTSNPVTAISNDSIISLPPSNDTDGDGVNDVDDEYPSDPLRAFNNFYPAKNVSATVAFEDLWPYYGDFDLNDVVVDYNYKIVTNGQNSVKDVNGTYTLRASGGQIRNAFAVQFPTTAANVSNLTGATLEAGQSNAVVKIINDVRSVQATWNTILTDPWADTVNYSVAFTLNSPIALSTFGLNEYNPFIWGTSDGKSRGYEIHLPGKQPTSLATESIFGTGDDRTSRVGNVYYLSKDNLPWAINIPQRFDYPIEKADIVTAHLKFAQWAQSNGVSTTDWYKNLSGYRNASKIYVKP